MAQGPKRNLHPYKREVKLNFTCFSSHPTQVLSWAHQFDPSFLQGSQIKTQNNTQVIVEWLGEIGRDVNVGLKEHCPLGNQLIYGFPFETQNLPLKAVRVEE